MRAFKETLRSVLLIMPALALTMPAFAQVRDPTLSDATEPGSVIVFPVFKETPVTLPEGGKAPGSVLKIGVVCPKGVTCSSDQAVTIRFDWVCPGAGPSSICHETDFEVTATVSEKIVLVADGTAEDGYKTGLPTKFAPPPPCGDGYLIGWVIDPATREPIKFDGLIGSADIRNVGPSLASYPAIPIQANPALANGAAITTTSAGGLVFDGGANHYQAVTGRVFGDVLYNNAVTGPTFNQSVFIFLTLDVASNRPNAPVFVDLDFFGGNPSVIGNENAVSTSTDFTCWGNIGLASLAGGQLTTTTMGLEGVVQSGAAQNADGDPVTLLGLFLTAEQSGPFFRETFNTLFNDSVPVPTTFVP
jgi:hypothetical protein